MFPQVVPFALRSPILPRNGYGDTLSSLAKMASQDAELARKEHEGGFKFVRSMHLVAIWSSLETCIEELLCVLYEYKNNSIKLIADSGYKKAKPVVGKSRAAYQIRRWETSLDEPLYLRRQMHMLGVLKFSVNFDEGICRKIQELSEMRNCIVHNKGRVDQKMIDRCPWINKRYQLGDEIILSSNDVQVTQAACGEVTVTLMSTLASSDLVPKK